MEEYRSAVPQRPLLSKGSTAPLSDLDRRGCDGVRILPLIEDYDPAPNSSACDSKNRSVP